MTGYSHFLPETVRNFLSVQGQSAVTAKLKAAVSCQTILIMMEKMSMTSNRAGTHPPAQRWSPNYINIMFLT